MSVLGLRCLPVCVGGVAAFAHACTRIIDLLQ